MRLLLPIALLAALSVPSTAQLSGNYTINPVWPTAGNNFASLLAAVTALNTGGVTGPVIFDIYDDAGPYNESHPFTTANVTYSPATAVLTLQQWTGSSATNRVTFRAAPGESPVFDATGRGMGVFWGGADYVTLEGIEIRNAPFDAVSLYSETTHGQVFGAVIRRCKIHDCGATGVLLYGNSMRPQNTRVENNFFWRLQLTNAGGFNTTARFGYVSGRRHDFSRIINNTFYVSTAVGSAFCVIGDLPSGGTGSHYAEVSNNIIVKTTNATLPIYTFPDNPAGTNGVPPIVDANCYFDTSGGPFSTGSIGASTFLQWQTLSGKDLNSVSADPLLAAPATGDLHLTATSPCINLSALPSGVTDDIDGDPRTGAPDVGADEFVGCLAPQYQVNSAAASLAIDGLQGSACSPAITTKAQGAAAILSFSSINTGLGWEAVLAAGPLLSASGGALQSASGQLLNINLASPLLIFLNGGAAPNFGTPFPGPFALGFTAPLTAVTASIQSAHVDPTNPDGIALSQGCQLIVP